MVVIFIIFHVLFIFQVDYWIQGYYFGSTDRLFDEPVTSTFEDGYQVVVQLNPVLEKYLFVLIVFRSENYIFLIVGIEQHFVFVVVG